MLFLLKLPHANVKMISLGNTTVVQYSKSAGPGIFGLPFYPQDGGSEF